MNLVLTGSSSGIGRALAERLLNGGHRVWGLARSDQTGFASRSAGAFRASRCDVTDWGQVERAAVEISANAGSLDALITCAGAHGTIGRTLEADPARWSAAVRANLDGTFHALRAFGPRLVRDAHRAKIVCFSGGGATKARPNFSAYAAAKAGIVRLVETVAEEERGHALDINAIAPGAIRTPLTDEIVNAGAAVVGAEEFRTAQGLSVSDRRPLDNALDLVEWLLSPASDGLTGRLLSAQWDPWRTFEQKIAVIAASDVYTLRRIVPGDRNQEP